MKINTTACESRVKSHLTLLDLEIPATLSFIATPILMFFIGNEFQFKFVPQSSDLLVGIVLRFDYFLV
jgi:hypothetical protein